MIIVYLQNGLFENRFSRELVENNTWHFYIFKKSSGHILGHFLFHYLKIEDFFKHCFPFLLYIKNRRSLKV